MMMKPTIRHLVPDKPSELALSFKILIPTAMMFFLFVYFSYFVMLPFVETYLMNRNRQMLRSMSNGVWHLFDDYRKKAESGEMTGDEARSRALEAAQSLRFGPDGKDYFWINDLSAVVLMHPYQPQLVGRSQRDYIDSSGCRVFVDAVNLVKRSKEGFIEYLWQWQDDPSRVVPKLSFVKLYEPWGWVLGTGLYVEDVHADIAILTQKLLRLLMGVVVVSLVFCFYIYQQASAVEVKRRRLEKINGVLIRISNAVNTTLDLPALYRSIHQSLGEIIDVSNFFIALYDRDQNAISFPYYQDEVDADYPEIEDIHHSGSLTARVIHTAAPVRSTREQTLAWAKSQGMPPVGTPAALWLGVPLKIKNAVIGVIATQSYTRSDYFDDTDMDVLVSVSDQVAVAIERKQNETALRHSVRQYQMLAENHRDVVVALSPSGVLTYCSPAIREFGDYEPSQEVGRHISAYFADAGEKDRGLRRFGYMVKHHQPGNFEMLFKPKNKAAFPVEIGLKPVVEDGQVMTVMCVMRDISERKAAEVQLKQARDALEIRVRERTDALLKINTQLENEIRKHQRTECILRESEEKLIQSERLAATGQLAASIAHEINSPLQGVTSLLNVIRREYGEDENLVGHLDLIKGAFNSIRSTVKNLMDLNRPGKEKNQPMRLQDIINQTGALVKSYLKDHGVRLYLDLPSDLPVIMGSPQQLGQVFMNLINNAIEAMNTNQAHEDRSVTIHAAVDGNQVAVYVEDTGTGISDEDLSHIFDAFFTRKKKMGMGVGLSICHRIVEDHNGTISVRNRPGRGAAFTVRLPCSR